MGTGVRTDWIDCMTGAMKGLWAGEYVALACQGVSAVLAWFLIVCGLLEWNRWC